MNKVIINTAFNSLALLLLGVLTSQKITAFNDILLISGADVESGSYYVTGGNFGYLLGTLLAGAIYGRVRSKPRVILVAMLCSATCTFFLPWCDVFFTMLLVHILMSTFNGGFEAFVNAEEVRAWDGNSDSAMQFLSFCYSLGGVFGPLLTEPFLAPKQSQDSNSTRSNDSFNQIRIPSKPASDLSSIKLATADSSFSPLKCAEGHPNCSDSDLAIGLMNSSFGNLSIINGNDSTGVHVESRLHYAFLISAVLTLLTAIPFFYLCVTFRSKNNSSRRQDLGNSEVSDNRLPRNVYLLVISLACLYYLIHSMAEDAFSQYLFYFAVIELDWSKRKAALLNSLYWGFSMCVKLALVFVLRRVDTGMLLFLSTIGMVVSSVSFSVAGQFHSNILIWISTCGFALSQSAVYAGEFSWVDSSLTKLGGRETSALMVFSGLGSMGSPLTLGPLMKYETLMAYPYTVVACCFIGAVLFGIKLFIVKPLVTRKYGPPRSPRSQQREMEIEIPLPPSSSGAPSTIENTLSV